MRRGEDRSNDVGRRGHRIFRRELVLLLLVPLLLLGVLPTIARQDDRVDKSLLRSVSRRLVEARRLCHGEGFSCRVREGGPWIDL